MPLHTFTVTATRKDDDTILARLSLMGADFVVSGQTPQDVRARLISKVQGYFDSMEQKRIADAQNAARTFQVDIEVYGFDPGDKPALPSFIVGGTP